MKNLMKDERILIGAIACFVTASLGVAAYTQLNKKPEPKVENAQINVSINAEADKESMLPAEIEILDGDKATISETTLNLGTNEAVIELPEGKYTINMTSAPIEADGSTYKVADAIEVKVGADGEPVNVEFELERLPVADMTQEQIDAIIARLEATDEAKCTSCAELIEKLKAQKEEAVSDPESAKDLTNESESNGETSTVKPSNPNTSKPSVDEDKEPSKPGTSEPEVDEDKEDEKDPETSEPEVDEDKEDEKDPETSEPEVDEDKDDEVKPEPEKPETGKPEPEKPETGKPETGKPDEDKDEPTKPTIVKPTSVSVAPSSIEINAGESINVSVTIAPSNTTDKKYTFSSENNAVATVNANGVISAKASGTTRIVVTASGNTNIKGYVSVTVNSPTPPPVQKDPLDHSQWTLDEMMAGLRFKNTYTGEVYTVHNVRWGIHVSDINLVGGLKVIANPHQLTLGSPLEGMAGDYYNVGQSINVYSNEPDLNGQTRKSFTPGAHNPNHSFDEISIILDDLLKFF